MLSQNERIRRREIHRIFYALERKLGVEASLYKVTSQSPNFETGRLNVTTSVMRIPRFITCSMEEAHKFEYDLGYLAANKNFTYGGLYEPGDRLGLFSGRNLPEGFRVEMSDYIVWDGQKYDIVRIQTYDHSAGFALQLRATKGQRAYQSHDRAVYERLPIVEEVTHEGV